jgi:hypothetical protein
LKKKFIPLRCYHQENSLNINHLWCPAFFLKIPSGYSAKLINSLLQPWKKRSVLKKSALEGPQKGSEAVQKSPPSTLSWLAIARHPSLRSRRRPQGDPSAYASGRRKKRGSGRQQEGLHKNIFSTASKGS